MTDPVPNRLSRKIGWLGLGIVAALAVAAGLASPAYAANFPHFKSASVSLASSSAIAANLGAGSTGGAATELPDLLYTWAEVGLGKADVVYRLETVVTVTFDCVNGDDDDDHPMAKGETTITVRVSVEFAADKNGRINGNVVVDTGSVSPTGSSCDDEGTPVALSATFTNNTITDTTNGVTATDDDISVTF